MKLLKPVFNQNGTITAANTSKINSKLGWESKDNLKSFINTIKENK